MVILGQEQNISSTEARIFMKFETYVHKIVIDHEPNFHKDIGTPGIIDPIFCMWAPFHRECARLCLVRAHLCTDLYENLVVGRLLSYEHKSQIS